MTELRGVESVVGEASRRITEAVSSWPDVSAHPHRFGGVEFRYGRVELGHIHGDVLADLPFPKATHDVLLAEGRVQPHHVLPDSGWISKRIETAGDVDEVIQLFRMNFERVARRRISSSDAEHIGSERRSPT